jgi:hypothetical protein
MESGVVVLEATTVPARTIQARVERQVQKVEATAERNYRCYIVLGFVVAAAVAVGVVLALVIPDNGSSNGAIVEDPTAVPGTPGLVTDAPTSAPPTMAPSTSPGDAILSRIELVEAIRSCEKCFLFS